MLFIREIPELRMNRGDTFYHPFIIYEGEKLDFVKYLPKVGDNIYLAIMEPNQPWEQAIIKKKISNDDLAIALDPKDTMCLLPGLYYCQIKCKLATGDVYTILPKRSFYIQE